MHVAHIDAFPQAPQGHGAVHGPGIDINESQTMGQPLGNGTLARARRSVNRYDYAFLICQLCRIAVVGTVPLDRYAPNVGVYFGVQSSTKPLIFLLIE